MKALIRPTLALFIGLAVAAPVFADSWDFGERLERQANRIQEGVDSGELSPQEAKVLYREHKEIKRLLRDFSEDRYISRREANILDARLDEARRHINDYKNNSERAYRGPSHHHHDQGYYYRERSSSGFLDNN